MDNVPELRFPEFSGEWEKTSIESLVKEEVIEKPMDGNHGNIHPVSSDFVDTGIPFIMANNVRNGKVDFINSKKITKVQADGLQKGFSYTGDVLLTHKGSVGNTAIVPKIATEYIMLTPQVTYYRVLNDKKFTNVFLKYCFDTNIFQKILERLSGGGTRAYIGITGQRKLPLTHPPQIPEQQKIAQFLTTVDTKIEQLTKKKTLLEQYKKGVSQKLFSQDIRFKADDGSKYPDWVEKKLGDVANCLDNRREPLNGSQRSQMKGEIPYYGANGIVDYVNDFIFDEELVLLAEDGGNFNDYSTKPIAQKISGKTWVNNHAHILQAKNIVTANFLFYSLVNKDIRKYIVGGGRAKLNKSDLLSIKIYLPSLPEQEKIANFLSSIYTKIEQATKQLNQTKQFKKALLQQMFV